MLIFYYKGVGENLPEMLKSAFRNKTIEKIQKVAALGSAEI